MTNEFKSPYQALHAAALTLSTKMLAALPQSQLDALAGFTAHGAKLMIEIELPNCKEVALVLRELEGNRLPVCKVARTI